VKRSLGIVLAAVLALAPSSAAVACICGLVPTVAVCDACAPVPSVAYVPTIYVPTTYVATAMSVAVDCSPVPTAQVQPTEQVVRRCYYEPRTTYRTVTQTYPQVSWSARCYYSPLTGLTTTVWVPTVSYVQRQYQLPVTTYVERCEEVRPTPTTKFEPAPAPAPARELPGPTTEQRYYYGPGRSPAPERAPDERQRVPSEQPPAAPDQPQPQQVPLPPQPEAAPEEKQPQPEARPAPQRVPPAPTPSSSGLTQYRWRPVQEARVQQAASSAAQTLHQAPR
jgi:hypothetical protein